MIKITESESQALQNLYLGIVFEARGAQTAYNTKWKEICLKYGIADYMNYGFNRKTLEIVHR